MSVSDGRRASIGDGVGDRARLGRSIPNDPDPTSLGGSAIQESERSVASSATVDHAKDPHRGMRVLF